MKLHSNKRRMKNLIGHVFGKLTVLHFEAETSKWECMCECGNIVKTQAKVLNSGNTKSCGCTRAKSMSDAVKSRHRKTRASQGRDPDRPLSSEDHLERLSAAPTMKEVMVRDDYTCVWCSTRGCKLSVHHIETWAINKNRRLDKTNLVTLCDPCHLKVHRNDYSLIPDPIMSILLEGYAKIKEDAA